MTNGAADCWGKNDVGQAADKPGPFTQVSTGANHNCALTPAGAADCWGSGGDNPSSDFPGPYSQINLTGGLCAMTLDGRIECMLYWESGFYIWTYDLIAGPYRPPAWPEIVAAGERHTCALQPSGAVDCLSLIHI